MADLVRKKVMEKTARKKRAHQRLRQKLAGTPERPRLSVYKSSKYVYAQVINDETGHTLVSANSGELYDGRGGIVPVPSDSAKARAQGKLCGGRAEQCVSQGVHVQAPACGGESVLFQT